MKIYITIQSLAKRKDYLTKKEIHLVEVPHTLRELLIALVRTQVQEFNTNIAGTNLVSFLTNEGIEQQIAAGQSLPAFHGRRS